MVSALVGLFASIIRAGTLGDGICHKFVIRRSPDAGDRVFLDCVHLECFLRDTYTGR